MTTLTSEEWAQARLAIINDAVANGATVADAYALADAQHPRPLAPIAEADGAQILDHVEAYLARFVSYPSVDARVAHVLWIAHTHAMDQWESTPRIAFLSPEPGSGKTRALEVTEPLVPRPIHSVNTTPAYLFRKVSDEAGAPTLLYDEIDTVFGPRAKDNEDIRGLLNAGHRRGATAGRCVVKGKQVLTEELPAYCAVALAGIDDLPDTLASRSVIVKMRRRAPGEHVEPFRQRLHLPEGEPIHAALEAWMGELVVDEWPDMPAGVEDRAADIWEPLLAIADYAGHDWPERARVAAVAAVAATMAGVPSLGVRLLSDIREIFAATHETRISSFDLAGRLARLEDAPWNDLRGKPLDAPGLARRLAKYEIKPRDMRIAEWHGKGYEQADFVDAWARYVAGVEVQLLRSQGGKTGLEGVDDSEARTLGVAGLEAATVATAATCSSCGRPLDPFLANAGEMLHLGCMPMT